ncbi:hypothetical protein [Nonomuraea gerenzanensis]|uniref:hypothetical protein n=1 Tax=Nonomuraea gerenzanensis TaxID=93944 RepID=UPI001CD9E7F0|nr:hypothetical protein [Nonomuraea gerenzanensis]UBU16641.1 hypothetical protein LCN96_16970 [Nonomuraea gerenzanensis]
MTTAARENAIKALAHRAYDRDHSEPGERASTTDFAFEFITWLIAQGWSEPPEAQPAPAPAPPRPPHGLRGPALARHALAQLALTKGDDGDH